MIVYSILFKAVLTSEKYNNRNFPTSKCLRTILSFLNYAYIFSQHLAKNWEGTPTNQAVKKGILNRLLAIL